MKPDSAKKNVLRKMFNSAELEGISRVIGDTNDGLTGSEIDYALRDSGINDIDPTNTKWRRVFNALSNAQNNRQCGNIIFTFINKCLAPARHFNNADRYRTMLCGVNKTLLIYDNMEFRDDGIFYKMNKLSPTTFSQAIQRASRFKEKLKSRNTHPFLIESCSTEISDENFFHAALEACKAVNSKVRAISGLDCDGSELYDKAFAGDTPLLKINNFSSKNEIGEQKGFVNMAKGLMGVFRNPTAHVQKTEWTLTEQDALDIFSMISYVLRRIENSTK